ncbi:ankyrin repeat domain-containing protein [Helicobacter sp. 23-1044]
MYLNNELLEFAKSGNLSGVKQCLANGANINFADEQNNTAIMYASMNGHLEVVKFLLEIPTAKIFIKNDDGKMAIDFSKTNEIKQCIHKSMIAVVAEQIDGIVKAAIREGDKKAMAILNKMGRPDFWHFI